MVPEIKDYNDVLVLARGLTDESVKQLGDGFQVKDLVPIVSENFQKGIIAVEGAGKIPALWKTYTEACTRATVEFAVDLACDLLKVPAGGSADFKETKDVLAAVSGLTASIIKHLDGGWQPTEYLELVSENFNALIIASDNASKIGDELKGDIRGFIKLVAFFAVDLAMKLQAAATK